MNPETEKVHQRIEQYAAQWLDQVDKQPHYPMYGAGKVLSAEENEWTESMRQGAAMGRNMERLMELADPDNPPIPDVEALTLRQFTGGRENALMMAVLYDVAFGPTRPKLKSCPHIVKDWTILKREMTMIEAGMIRMWCCGRCTEDMLKPEMLRRWDEIHADRHCDVCLQEAETFAAHVGYLRTVMITFHIGECCEPLVTYRTPIKETYKAPRNDPCPCGSGRKFKHCHGGGSS